LNSTKSFARLASTAIALLLPALVHAQPVPVAYVTNQSLNVVHMFRTSDFFPLGNIPVGQSPTGIAIPTSGGFALVANKGGESVSRIDLATSTVVATIPVPGNPTSVAIMPDGSKAYVAQPNNCPLPPVPTPSPTPPPLPTPTGIPTPSPIPTASPAPTPTPWPPCTVAVIDLASNTVTGTITVGHAPYAVAIAPSGGFAYVTNRDDGTVSQINTVTDTVIEDFEAGDTPEGVFVGFGQIYITNDVSETVSVYREIDFQPLATLPTGGSPLSVAVSPDGLSGIIGNDADGTVTIINTDVNSVRATATVGSNPAGIAITHDSTRAVVANTTAGSITIVPLDGSPPLNISVLGSPSGVVIAPTPYFVISKTAVPAPVAAGGTVFYTIDYENRGSGNATGVTITDTVPVGLTFVSATSGGALVGSDVVWTIGDVGISAVGQVQATFTVDPLIADGTVLWNTVTIADAIGNQAVATIPLATRVPGGFGVNNATYYRKGDGHQRDTMKFRAEFLLPTDFDNDGLTIAWTNGSQILDVFNIPAGAFSHRSGTTRFRFNGYLVDGSRVLVRMNKGNNGFWKMSLTHTRLTLPLATDFNILVTGVFGTDLLASQRTFELKRSKPGSQKLFFRGISTGGM